MASEHPNVALISQLDPANLTAAPHLFADDVVFHYFNPNLPDLQGDYTGIDGIRDFFERIGALSEGTFRVHPVAATAAGDELVVVRTQNSLTFGGEAIKIDVVVVWRIVNGRVTEVWDIPSAFTTADGEQA